MLPIFTFAAVVVLSFGVHVWVRRAGARYMVMRLERTGDIPPLADPSVAEELYSRPWLWPLRAGSIFRAQTKWNQVRHSDPALDAAQRAFDRRQRAAVVVYLAGVAAVVLSPFVHIF